MKGHIPTAPVLLRGALCFLAALAVSSSLHAENVFCRFQADDGAHYGRLESGKLAVLSAAPWNGGHDTGQKVSIDAVHLLAPSEPRTILGIAGAYATPDTNPPRTTRWFAKSASGAAADGDPVTVPPALDALKAEVELVIVIGRHVKNAGPAEARQAIFGYTAGTELFGFVDSYHRANGEEPNRTEKVLATGLKLGDGLAPFGPCIHTGVEWGGREARLTVTAADGKAREGFHHNTSQMRQSPEQVISDLSRVLSLEPGDIVFSGSSRSVVVKPGDTVKTEVEGLGTLTNHIVRNVDPEP